MITVSLAEAQARLGELLDLGEGGEDVIVTRGGKPVAHMHPPQSPKRPLRNLAAFRAGMPDWGGSSVSALRELRDESL
jgi:antitoxin (DNA-binding transcriptional repressor) of toxin-antitoxin stability system